jgi:hypothetical protein
MPGSMVRRLRPTLDKLLAVSAAGCVVAAILVAPGAALAASGPSGGAGLGGGPAPGGSGSPAAGSQSGSGGASPSHAGNQPASHQTSSSAAGQVVGLSWASFTVQTGGRRLPVVQALIAAANALNADNYPYVWAGGHPAAGAASVGTRGPGYTGHTIGFDCSGSVAAVLSAAGLWQPGTPVPGDAGVIAQLRQDGVIARGVGRGAASVTLYDDPGVHIFMNIGGRFFGTGANATGGPGWLTYSGVTRAFKPWHFVPSALSGTATYGPELTFGLGKNAGLMYGLNVGERVQVRYDTARDGALTATEVTGG